MRTAIHCSIKAWMRKLVLEQGKDLFFVVFGLIPPMQSFLWGFKYRVIEQVVLLNLNRFSCVLLVVDNRAPSLK